MRCAGNSAALRSFFGDWPSRRNALRAMTAFSFAQSFHFPALPRRAREKGLAVQAGHAARGTGWEGTESNSPGEGRDVFLPGSIQIEQVPETWGGAVCSTLVESPGSFA